MDTSAFDRIARLLGGAATRRAGLGAAAVALLGGAASAAAGPGGQSQCGGRTSSTCKKDGDCCSGRCNLQKGKANKDGLGRCRCSRRDEQCSDDKDCCSRRNQGLVCTGGVCSPPCVPLNSPCNGTVSCCAGECVASAVAGERAVEPSCCIQVGKTGCKTDDNCCQGGANGSVCEAGTCVAACIPLQASCTTGAGACCAGSCAPYTWTSGVQAQVQTACCVANGATGCTTARDCCTNGYACISGRCET